MTGQIVFDPLIPWPLLIGVAMLVAVAAILALWRGLIGWPWRLLAGLVLLGALAGPAYQEEDRDPLTDIVLLLDDQSASQQLSDRPDQTAETVADLESALASRSNVEIRRVTVGDGEGDAGTRLMEAMTTALADEPSGRVAGIIAVTDGQIHDIDRAPNLPAPMHVLLTGRDTDWDRRLTVKNAPAFAIIGEPVTLTLRVDDSGAAPNDAELARLDISVDGAPPQSFRVPIGEDIDLPVSLPHGGRNVIQFTVPEAEGELTERNNSAVIQMNGVRDRLRVLLVSGEPHAGGRTWRNLLKSDSSVDLVHFTILRPPEKQDGVPVGELSLIAFPTRELFLEKIDEFDLIIFDRYKRRGILPPIYLDNVAQYVRRGGAVLVAAGDDFASADSIFRSPLGAVLPAVPSARVIEDGFVPAVSDLGARHPVTTDLPNEGNWGRWFKQIDVTPRSGDVVMEGLEDRPLLVLDRVGEGRVALLASDHAWLWSRGYEGGGPQLELLRRLGHWMMKEPELEEEVLFAEATGQTMRVIRRTLTEEVGPVTITQPNGETVEIELEPTSPGRFEALFEGPEIGLYRLSDGTLESVIGLGPAAPREFEQTIATPDILNPTVEVLRGGMMLVQNGVPSVRSVREGRPAAGRLGWFFCWDQD